MLSLPKIRKKNNMNERVYFTLYELSGKRQGTSFLVELNCNNGRTRERGKIYFLLLSFFFELLEFLSSKERMRLFFEVKRGWRRSIWWSGMERVYEYSYFWWSILWGFGVVFIVVFLEKIIIISHMILWIWEISFENYFCLVLFFPKVSTWILKKNYLLVTFSIFIFDLNKISWFINLFQHLSNFEWSTLWIHSKFA